MGDSAHSLLVRLFRKGPEPRMAGKISHSLPDILVIVFCSILAGLEQFTKMEDYGKANEAWFRTFLDLSNGIPSHDTFGNVLAALDPLVFEQAIRKWLAVLAGSTQGKHIALEGKSLRGSFPQAAGKLAVHLVNEPYLL